MIWLRSLLFFIWLVSLTIVYALFCLLVFLFISEANRYRLIQFWAYLIIHGLRIICGVAYEIKGIQHAHEVINQPIIILSKHQSAWETIAFLTVFPKPLCYVFKRELLWIPFFGWVMALLKMIHIDRSAKETAALSVTNQGKQRLREGKWIILFPEGTRTPVGSHKPYRKGGARLATLTNAIVLPVAHNAGNLWPRNSFLKRPGLITVSIGPSIDSQDKTGDQLNHEVESWIEGEMKKIDPAAYS